RAKVTEIEEAKYLATLPFDELIRNLKVCEMVLDNDGIESNTTKEKLNSLALKAKVTMEKTSDDSDSQGGSDEDVDEEEAGAFNLMARNFYIVDLQKANEELLRFNKDFTKTFEKLKKQLLNELRLALTFVYEFVIVKLSVLGFWLKKWGSLV
nr:transposase, Ptta/En/Spm, transposase, Tnp1/En/Spm-like protein [Tanacetum cinerariifolium]